VDAGLGAAFPAVRALAAQGPAGLTAMLPGERVAALGAALAARFGLPCWQLTQSASDANREALRWARWRAEADRGRPVVACSWLEPLTSRASPANSG